MPQNSIPLCKTVNLKPQASLSFGEQIDLFFSDILSSDEWPKRWYCGNWTEFHGWLYILSDVAIWAAYFAIPLMLMRVVGKLRSTPFYRIVRLFIAFIMLCGLTHLMDAVIFWWPAYRLSALIRFFTAIISIVTVYTLYKNLQLILSLRTLAELDDEISKRQNVEVKLEESKFLLSAAESIARVGGWERNLLNQKTIYSQTFLEIIGVQADHFCNDGQIFRHFDRPDQLRLIRAIRATRTSGLKWDLELPLITVSGKRTWVRVSGEPLYGADGQVIKVRGILMDIDRYKTTELALNKSLEISVQSNAQLKNFTHILSHNIRNHATNLQMVSSLVDAEKLDKENLEFFEMIYNVSTGLNSTLDDLSSALKFRENIIQSEILSFKSVTDGVINVLESYINANRAVVECHFKVKHVKFPKIYLESIILNLLSNAIKYRRQDVDLNVQLITSLDSTGNIMLECRDNGLGIDLGLHGQRIFGLYRTFHDHKDAHGVGLFLVKSQVESQGGRIELESTLGKGSNFKIIFNENSRAHLRH